MDENGIISDSVLRVATAKRRPQRSSCTKGGGSGDSGPPKAGTVFADDRERRLTLAAFRARMDAQDWEILWHVASQHKAPGLSSSDVLEAGLARIDEEHHAADQLDYGQWMQIHIIATRREGWRLKQELLTEARRLEGLERGNREDDGPIREFKSPVPSPLDVLLEAEYERECAAREQHVITTMEEIVDDLVSQRKIISTPAEVCKRVFSAYISDPSLKLVEYGRQLAPKVRRQRLDEIWKKVVPELIERLGGEFFVKLGRPKGPQPVRPSGAPRRLRRDGTQGSDR